MQGVAGLWDAFCSVNAGPRIVKRPARDWAAGHRPEQRASTDAVNSP